MTRNIRFDGPYLIRDTVTGRRVESHPTALDAERARAILAQHARTRELRPILNYWGTARYPDRYTVEYRP